MPSLLTADESLEQLKAGNARFVAGTTRAGRSDRGADLVSGQDPFAVVLGCSDSRVPIEAIFDLNAGDAFVIRVAGNFLNDDNLGSIEYGIEVLKAKLILVLGHENCGAVTAAVDYVRTGVPQPGHIQGIVEALEPAALAARTSSSNWLKHAIAQNVLANVKAIAESEIIAAPVKAGIVKVIGGIYNLSTGIVVLS